MTTLDLTTTAQLVDELKRRYPLLMIAGSVDIDARRTADLLLYHGNMLALIGLAHVCKHDLTVQYVEALEPTDDTP